MSKENERFYFENRHAKEINIKDFLRLLRKRFWIIALITMIATLAGYFYSNHNNSPLYQTSTRVLVGSGSENMKTLMVMIKDPSVMEKVKEDLHLSRSAEGMAGQIEVTRLDESQVIKISVIDSDPLVAASIANMTAKVFKKEIANILDFKDVKLLSAAKENPYPINATQNRTIIIALVFGLITGTGLVILLESLDGTIRKDREVEAVLGVPVLGVISNMNKKKLAIKRSSQNAVEVRGETVGVE